MTLHDLKDYKSVYGWQCPICGRIWSPAVKECEFCNRAIDQPIANATIGWVPGPKETK